MEMIINEAWNFKTVVTGGFWGLVIIGIRRAMFSNEAGLGSAPMYHGQSKNDEPIKEGLVAMLGPFIDTPTAVYTIQEELGNQPHQQTGNE